MSDGYDFSQLYHASLVRYSPGTTFLATLYQNRIIIRSTASLQIVRTWACHLPNTASSSRNTEDSLKIDYVEWSEDGLHLLVFSSTTKTAWVFGLASEGDGESGKVARIGGQGMEGLVRVEWGKNGKQVMAWSDHSASLSIYDLSTGQTKVIQNSKSPYHCNTYSPDKRYLAIVEKHLGKEYIGVYDILDSYNLLRHFQLSTIDVQGISWSPCGRYLAAWDSSLSYSIYIHSPLGPILAHFDHTSPTFSPMSTAEDPGLGIRTVTWAPGGRWLALGGWDGKVRILEHEGWRCIGVLSWRSRITEKDTVWREPRDWVKDTRGRGIIQFDRIQPPTSIPTIRPDLSKPNPNMGVSHISFDRDGALVFVRLESSPNVIHIYTFLKTPGSESPDISHLTGTIFENQIRSAEWCPSGKGRGRKLAVTCKTGAVYLWDEEGGGWEEEDTDGESESREAGGRGGMMEGVGIPARSEFSASELHWAPDGSSVVIQDKSQFCLLYLNETESDTADRSMRWDGTDEGLSHVVEEEEEEEYEEGWSGYGLGFKGGLVGAVRA
uniref:Uncharacterized protein n=1 Tax=Kwoniella bestiolae CBS 10118 TaxID=1296100 RepID=A0A1B9GFG2_9TREE|nr:hypothetical protein I302_01193 [Kwoniella bestiolae CBS 10118]OCF29681.1 hypothetical protein I302_01193 [Kwoniella bestiolae CBS 10118]